MSSQSVKSDDHYMNFFAEYYSEISKNGQIKTFLDKVENMDDFCDLFDDILNNEEPDQLNVICEPIRKKERNRDILHAANVLKIEHSEKLGRHLVATTKITSDVILINEQPTVLQVQPLCQCVGQRNRSLYRCHNCGMACKYFYTCDGCNVCVFCSRLCQYQAYAQYHRYECYGLQRHFWSMKDTDYSYISFRMMLYGASKKFVTKLKKYEKYGNFDNNYPFVDGLVTNVDKLTPYPIRKALDSAVQNLIYLIKKTNFFRELKVKFSTQNIYYYIGGVLLKHYYQAQMNSIILKFPNLDAGWGIDVVSGTGKAICPTIALINHSCSPNCIIMIRSNYLQVRSVKPIRSGEAITVCYAEVNAFDGLPERRLITEELLCFTCNCYFCLYEERLKVAPFKCPDDDCEGFATLIQSETALSLNCILCGKIFRTDDFMVHWKTAKICKILFEKTGNNDHLKRALEHYKCLFPTKSHHLMAVYQKMAEVHYELGKDPIEIIKYTLLMSSLNDHSVDRLYLKSIIAKLDYIHRIMSFKCVWDMGKIEKERIEILRLFVNEVVLVKEDLMFHLPAHKITYYNQTVEEVRDLFKRVAKLSGYEGYYIDSPSSSECTDDAEEGD